MAIVGESVQFRTGTYAEYLKVSLKDPNSVYFCEDTQQLFVGEIEYTRTLGETADKAYPGDKGAVAYKHANTSSGNPHNVTKSDVGLSNVTNTKAVSVEASQGLTESEKLNARANIGAGTSNFDGNYSSLSGTPTLGSAASKDVATAGNASIDQVVKGNDTRLSDARPASDVSSWAKAASKPSYTASEVGLGNVGNYKAVSTVANQQLSDSEKAAARANIGAGTGSSSFSGAYADLSGTPALGTAASKDVAATGNASESQVVLGNDSRLTDARPASDVSSWAKAAKKPEYTKSEVGLSNVGNFKAVSTVASQGLTDTEKSNARANIGAGTGNSNFSGAYADLSGKPTLGSAAAKDVATSGNATAAQVVMGNDTRLTNARPASDVSGWAKAANKPSYTASEVGAIANTTTHLSGDIATIEKGAANGVATLDADGKVPSSQLPSYVDDVLEYSSLNKFPASGESGKIYVATDTNKTYRWSGTAYVEISPSIVVGTTTGTAFDGKVGNNHVNNKSNPHGVTAAQLGLGNVGNFKAVSTVASQGLTDAEKANARANIGAGTGSSNFSGSYADLSGTPTLGTAAAKNVPASGNAATTEVVLGSDTRLTNSRPASDVAAWAKAATKPTYAASEVGLGNVPNVTTNNQTPTFTVATARENIKSGETIATLFGKIMKFFADLKTVAFTGSYTDLSNKPTIPTNTNQLTNGAGFTTNTGTITGITMNGKSKGSSGEVDLGTVLTGGSQTSTSTADSGSNVYTFSDGSTITVKNGSKGSTGSAGTNGANGTSAAWFTGTAVTGTSTTATAFTVSGSKAGDMYLNTSTYNVYRAAAANSWIYVCNIKGATGANGTNGTNGTTPTIKAAAGSSIEAVGTPSVTAATSGTTTTFTFNNLKGATGATGPQGEKGATGATGPQGPSGTSVTVSKVSESAASGGSNVVTFSDGKTVTIKNGVNGTNGTNGTNGVTPTIKAAAGASVGAVGTPTVTATTSGTTTTFTFNNLKGATGATGPQGPQGEKGDTGATGPQGPKGADATVPVIPWSTWSTLTDTQRAAYGLVVVTDQP